MPVEPEAAGIRAEYAQLARQAEAEDWPCEEHLRELPERELQRRERSVAAQRLHEARFPEVKTLEQIDWSAIEGVSKRSILELASRTFIEKAEDAIIAGPIGTGKSCLGVALGVAATKRRFRVLFVKAADLVRQLIEARDERLLSRLHRRLRSVNLLIVYEIGSVPLDRTGGELLFNLIADRYERRPPPQSLTRCLVPETERTEGGGPPPWANRFRECTMPKEPAALYVADQLALSLDAAPPGTYRQRVITFSLERSLLNERLARNMLDWTHSGFSVGASTRIPAGSAKRR